jgi:putative ABC transport system substrate-binding protein
MATIARRELLAALGGAAAWPIAARGQQAAMPLVGFLRSTSLADATHLVTAFRQGLKEGGFVEGQNVAVEYRSAEGRADRLPGLVTELIGRRVAVFVGNNNSALAAKAVTTTLPIVFATGIDPVTQGLVASLNRPDGNVTGVNFFGAMLGAKRLELLRQLAPKATTIGMLVNPNSPDTEEERREVEAAAQTVGQQLIILKRSEERWRPPRKRSGSNSSFSMPAATATSRLPLQCSPSAGPAHCLPVPARS